MRLNRRRFLCDLAGAAVGVTALRGLTAAAARPPASERVTLGFIGLGDHGVGVNLATFLGQPDAQVVALCDVDAGRLRSAAERVAQQYAQGGTAGNAAGIFTTPDWREVVARDDVDAVVVSTPDHWHVLPSVAAARAGKDVFCEKPLTLTVCEGRILSDTMRRYSRVFQTASENRSMASFHRAAELVRNGRLGRLLRIRTELPGGHGIAGTPGPNHAPEPVPPGFDFDMWLGQAPEAYYTPARCHFNFRWILDYSGGMLTDWGAHLNDIAQWGNDSELTGPVSVEGRGYFPADGLYNTATQWEITYEYANGVTLVCASGTPSIRFEGTDGWLEVPDWGAPLRASNADLLAAPILPGEIRLRTNRGREQREFLDCIRSRRPTYASAEIGHRTMTLSHIGNIAMLLGRKLRWDPASERFAGDDQANRMLSRTMRPPWVL
jgi:predicted dehydrogenase